MKYTYIKFILAIVVSSFYVSCSDSNEVDAKYGVEEIGVGAGKDASYYYNLRQYKATMHDRKIAFGWFGGWNATGAFLKSSLAGLPDSMDVVSLWDNWSVLDEVRIKDLTYVQKVKGMRVVGCDLLGDIGKGYTPEGVDFNEYWGWEGDLMPANRNEIPTPAQEAAIRKHAQAIVKLVNDNGLDGFDIDYEIGWGSKGSLVEYNERMFVFVDELGKHFGPKSGTDKILIVDGAICNIPPKIGEYFDWFVIQAYRAPDNNNLNNSRNRFGEAVDNLKDVMPSIEAIANKIVMAEEYEQSQWQTGGVPFRLDDGTVVNSLKGMALWQPLYKGQYYPRSGGVGVYHIEYEYDVNATNNYKGFYPWIREAIQIMNPAVVQ